jgi:hypothetical protein
MPRTPLTSPLPDHAKKFATLEGSQTDVATIVKSLYGSNLTAVVQPLKNVASSAKLTDPQKQLIGTIADKYAPGWQKPWTATRSCPA